MPMKIQHYEAKKKNKFEIIALKTPLPKYPNTFLDWCHSYVANSQLFWGFAFFFFFPFLQGYKLNSFFWGFAHFDAF